MTREKAYEILDKHPLCNECDSSFPYNCNECGEAFLTAFDALKQPEIIRCKDCIHYGKPEYGYTKGDCRFHTAWYPVDENDYCSKAQRRTDTN